MLSNVTTPSSFVCAITQDIMTSPVLAADGHRYEKDAIVEWIRRAGTSPLTRQALRVEDLRQDDSFRSEIVCWRNNLIKRGETAEGPLQLGNELERNNPSYGMGHVVVQFTPPVPEEVVVTPPAPLTPSAQPELTVDDLTSLSNCVRRTYFFWLVITLSVIIILTFLGVWGKFI